MVVADEARIHIHKLGYNRRAQDLVFLEESIEDKGKGWDGKRVPDYSGERY